MGQWIDVVIDDYLPFDSNNNLIFCHNIKIPNELFIALFEKAYAKYSLYLASFKISYQKFNS